MNYLKFIVSNQKEVSISIQRVNISPLYSCASTRLGKKVVYELLSFNSLPPEKFCSFFVICSFFFKTNFFENFFQEYHQSVKQFESRPELGPYCLQRLSADDKELNL